VSISAFSHALRAFHSGDLTQDELAWEIDRQLAIEKASPVALLEILKIQQVAQPLPSDAHEAIVNHLEEWPRDPTIVTGPSREKPAGRPMSTGVGDILQGRFSLVALIGEGGMSRVFKAIDLRRVEAGAADSYVAVKVLTEPFSDYFGSIVALQRETHKLQSLTHPNVVRVIDCDRDGHTVFMTMEYLAGESLQKKLRAVRSTGLDHAAAISLVAAVGDALEYAHRNHIVHGDLKPGNIIVTDKGTVKVIDFGMARFIARPEEGLAAEPLGKTTPKAVTPRYASPEMVAGRDPEPADDVYALACIAYEALSGRHPFGRLSDPRSRDPRAQPPRPREMRRHQHAALVKALAYDRQQRTASVRQFLDEFLATRRDVVTTHWRWLVALSIVVLMAVAYRLYRPVKHPEAVQSAAVADVAPGTLIHDCPTCPSMVVVPAGTFQQGGSAPETSPSEGPQHTVVIGHPFAMSSNDVTVAEFREFAAQTHRDMNGCNVYDGHWQYQKNAGWQAPGFAQNATHPVTCVSWDDALAYAQWLSGKGGHVYRLPSASEWEYAARAGGDAAQPWGANQSAACAEANLADESAGERFPGWSVFPCTDGYVNTAPVGSFKANAFGLYDLLGNVFEWVQDCWHDDYTGAPVDGTPWLDGVCKERELRGGSWFTPPKYVSASYRNRFDSAYRSNTVGFRVVREMSR
jgi:formylglycine-generating enzyme required for sulfatase activity